MPVPPTDKLPMQITGSVPCLDEIIPLSKKKFFILTPVPNNTDNGKKILEGFTAYKSNDVAMGPIKIKDVIACLERWAPPAHSESYDNVGLICGHPDDYVRAALICLDCTEAVVQEAIQQNCNLIIAHHPPVFTGIKKLTGSHYVERTLIQAIKNDIAIYALHTNLDNVVHGVNHQIACKLGLVNLRILQPRRGLLSKLVTFCPKDHHLKVLDALFAAGAGHIGNYSECSFNIEGTGTFKAEEDANPYLGQIGKRHYENEIRIEIIFENLKEAAVMKALRDSHPYEEIAYYLTRLDNTYQNAGSGMIGELQQEMDEMDFLKRLMEIFHLKVIRHTALLSRPVKRVALCGGAGSFLLKDAINAQAQVFISADFKYHQFFDANGSILIADIGHYESEQFTTTLIADVLSKNLPTFAHRISAINTNPVFYFKSHGN